ncbi:A/G-specific adenine glycosylase [Staphylococcus canis]|uniref:Adenine DNA glycosylase n=1 Tax=Staphylococcus canis TaxID=2724942 RepID=A0ABS0T7P8_9STAP|nr:A/G-specific adenine glycosylase [Staphylococcus canis]MBI5974712.1 A/G-specific adenine glycosylase [Staphylococcus canis]
MFNAETFKAHLVEWFNKHQRQMPWRETKDPYAIWVSEVMLQQTQVDTVRSYYERFLNRFPNVETLAKAREEEVLKYWEGLGYYSRARNFHTAAQEVVTRHGGIVPKNPDQFKALKGVGPYTQAAVLSIAFDTPLPTVDGNVFRVWSRLNNDSRDIQHQRTRKAYESELSPYVQQQAGTFNQAMMELGALICTPKAPLCLFCPVQSHCEAFHEGTVMDLPVKSKKVKKEIVDLDVFIIRDDLNRLLVEQRQERLLNGMWQFPLFEKREDNSHVKKVLGASFQVESEEVFQLKHQFTHKTWQLHVHYASLSQDDLDNLPKHYQRITFEEKEQLTFPVSMTRIFDFVKKALS